MRPGFGGSFQDVAPQDMDDGFAAIIGEGSVSVSATHFSPLPAHAFHILPNRSGCTNNFRAPDD